MKMKLRFSVFLITLALLMACGGGSAKQIPIGDTGILIDEVVLTDRFPPDCESGSPACTLAGEGSQYLWIYLSGMEFPTFVSKAGGATVTDSSGTTHTLGNGLWMGRLTLVQKVPKNASGFTLNFPGEEPIALGK